MSPKQTDETAGEGTTEESVEAAAEHGSNDIVAPDESEPATTATDSEAKEADKPAKSGWFSGVFNLSNASSAFSFISSVAEGGGPEGMPKSLDELKTMDPKKMDLTKVDTGKLKVDTPDGAPDKEQLMKALAAQQQATGLMAKAAGLRDTALKAMDSKERQKMIQEAYDKEIEANGQSKFARRLQSGPWQGGAGGAGIGAGVGTALGTVVGTVVGTVATLPTAAVGGLVGIGVGGIHGPFVKLDQSKAKKADGKIKEAEKKAKEAGKSAEEIEAAKMAALQQVADAEGGEAARPRGGSVTKQKAGDDGPPKPRKKPKKLEVRSNKTAPKQDG